MSGEHIKPAAPIPGEPMDIMTALELVVRKSRAYGGLVVGPKSAIKAIEKNVAKLCVLSADFDEPDCVKLFKALCAERNVSLLTVATSEILTQWVRFWKVNSKGKVKSVNCICLVVQEFREEHAAYNVVLQYLKSNCSMPL